MSSDTVKVYVTGLAPGDGYIIDVSTYIGEGYQVPEPARKKKLEVHRITRWDVGGRVFCYVLTVGEPGLGLLHALTFRDEDGDGRFEVVSEGDLDPSAYSPPLPDWSVK